MLLQDTPSYALLHRLNTLGYRDLWVNNRVHLKSNHRLTAISTRYVMSSFSTDDQQIFLPTSTACRVYQTDSNIFFGTPALPDQTWVDSVTCATTYGLDLVTYSKEGRLCDPSSVWIYFDPYGGSVFVCVDVTSLLLTTGSDQPTLYQTMYLTDGRAAPTITAFTLTASTAGSPDPTQLAKLNTAIAASISLSQAGTVVIVNGYPYPSDMIPAFNSGDHVVVTCDPTVTGSFDITIDDSKTGYFSTKYAEYREIIHVPKALNPNNVILSDAELTVMVYDPNTKKPVYLHRVQDNTIKQITHNDFTISRAVVNTFRDSMNAAVVNLRVLFRFPNRVRYLKDDVSHIIDLYTLPDTDIIPIMTGNKDISVPEWTAVSLETSGLIALEENFPSTIDSTILDTYVKALGYYRTAALISQSHTRYILTGSAIGVKKPLWLTGLPCACTVYANGIKIPDVNVRVADRDACSFYLSVDISDTVPLGSVIDVDICEGDDRIATTFVPQTESLSITMDSPYYDVYVRNTMSVPMTTVSGTTSYVYKPLAESSTAYHVTQTADGYVFTFNSVYRNYTCILSPRTGRQCITIDMDKDIATKRAFTYTLYNTTTSGDAVPLMGTPHLSVYINGHRLVPDIDYEYIPSLTNTSSIVSTDLVISNQRYVNLTGTGNLLEVVVDSSIVVTQDIGYNRGNVFVRSWTPEMWDDATSRLFNCGQLVSPVIDNGAYLTTTSSVRDGSPFLSEWLLPYGVQLLLVAYTPDTDIALRKRIDSYLMKDVPVAPEFIHLYDSYSLYSPYIATVINAVIAGTFTAVDDPSDTLFLSQFAQFDYIKDRDPVILANNPYIDRKLVDIAPHYVDYTVTDATQLRIVRRLIALTLTNQQPTFGVTYT